MLEACGVNKSLMKLGVKEGDSVMVGDVSLDHFTFCPLILFCSYPFLTHFLIHTVHRL